MNRRVATQLGRRAFLRFLTGSPLLTSAGIAAYSEAKHSEELKAIGSAADAINVFDLETAARLNLPPAHFGYIATGVDDDLTLRANREGFQKFHIRSRRLVDTTRIDMNVKLFDTDCSTPIVLAPAGSQCAFHPEGELATAKAAKARGHLQILSTVTTVSVEDVVAARGSPVWYQLYASADWTVTRGLINRAQRAGCKVLVLTVDQPAAGNRETLSRFSKRDDRKCNDCHSNTERSYFERRPMYKGMDISKLTSPITASLTWDFVDRLRDATPMKVVLKGIVTSEDASLAVQHGVDGIIVSNHGGRSEESGRSTIESLPEVVQAVRGKIPVLVDSGFRRGTDIFKALALGATSICIGRPYLWGLAAFGQLGVERVLEILSAELQMVMRMNGAPTLSSITGKSVRDSRIMWPSIEPQ